MILHPDDERALDFEFDSHDHADDREHKIADALGIDVNAIRGLAGSILSDVRGIDRLPKGVARVEVDEAAFGISWWVGYEGLGLARRLLIGDYLIEVVNAVETNLVESRLHLSAARPSVTAMETVPAPEERPREYLRRAVAQLQLAGMLRASMSAIDCLGAASVGVLGLPLSIKRATFGSVRRWLSEARNAPSSRGLTFQVETASAIISAFEGLEPTGWLRWASSYRHTFVHRGRRHQRWHPGVGLRMPSEPDRSELESLLASPFPEALDEPGEETLAGVMHNVQIGTFEACTHLVQAWQARRADPALVEQPREQWRDAPPLDTGASFAGFAPRPLPDVKAVVMNPSNVKRWEGAAVDPRVRHLWRTCR